MPENTIMLKNNLPPVHQDGNSVSLQYILEQLEKIQSQTDYLFALIEAMKGNPFDGVGIGAGNIVEEREKTNRQLIAFYQRIYEDLLQGRLSQQK